MLGRLKQKGKKKKPSLLCRFSVLDWLRWELWALRRSAAKFRVNLMVIESQSSVLRLIFLYCRSM